jgi:hypothetical protein
VLNSTGCADGAWYLDTDAGLAPMSPFRVVSVTACQCPVLFPWISCYRRSVESRLKRGGVPNGVTGSKTNPLWDGSVLLLGSGELDLCSEGLVALEGSMSVFLYSNLSITVSRGRCAD